MEFGKKSYFCSMMELERHIEILLLSNDCVIVPGLGGLMAHHLNAHYDESDGMFLPPQRTLGFNSQLDMSDSLLAQSYVEAYDISYPEAVSRIENEVNRIKLEIETKGSYQLHDLGRLFVNGEGCYEFEPCQAGLLTPKLYALSAFEMLPVRQGQKRHGTTSLPSLRMETKAIDAQRIAQSLLRPEKPSLATIMSQIDNIPPQEEKTISIRVSLLRNLAVTAVAALALVFFARPVNPNESAVAENTPAEASLLKTVMPSSEASSLPELTSIVADLEQVAGCIEKAQEVGVTPAVGDYTIVLGYSMPLENAKAFLQTLHENGARKAVLMEYKSENVIVYGSYPSSDEALQELQTLLANKNAASGWIMQVK